MKPIYDGLLQEGKPDSASLGLLPISIDYGHETRKKYADIGSVTANLVEKWSRKQPPNALRIHDHEPTEDQPDVFSADVRWTPLANAAKQAETLKTILRASRRGIRKSSTGRTGLYGWPIIHDNYADRDVAKNAACDLACDLMAPVGELCDVICFDLYPWWIGPDWFSEWRRSLLANVARAHIRYPNKPIVLFVSFQATTGEEVPASDIAPMMQAAYDAADELVMWGGFWEMDAARKLIRATWKPNAAWWQAFQAWRSTQTVTAALSDTTAATPSPIGSLT